MSLENGKAETKIIELTQGDLILFNAAVWHRGLKSHENEGAGAALPLPLPCPYTEFLHRRCHVSTHRPPITADCVFKKRRFL